MTVARLSFLVTAKILDGSAVIAPVIFDPRIDDILSNDDLLVAGDYDFTSVTAPYGMGGATLTVIPEPSSAALLGAALIGLAAARRRRANNRSGQPRILIGLDLVPFGW